MPGRLLVERYAGSVRYLDRTDAGQALAAALRAANFHDTGLRTTVLGVARGGVVVAAPIARAFGAPLGVIVARKLGAPGNPELAIGAIGRSGEAFVDDALVKRLRVSPEYLEAEVERQRRRIDERVARYGVGADAPDFARCEVAVVDDGVATGATLIAALRSVRASKPERLICAVPVGPPETLRRLEMEADMVVCPNRPTMFAAVGQWYEDFRQTTDREVIELLEASQPKP
jgi:predicted phosphoribosyltransferase